MNTATVTTTPTVSPFIQNLQQQQPQKPQTSKEAIAANVKALIEQLEEGHSEGLTAYLMAMGRFHNYSFGNILEIARQKPSATRVAGMYAWNQLGRRVNKGEKGRRNPSQTTSPLSHSSPQPSCDRFVRSPSHPQQGCSRRLLVCQYHSIMELY
jgi:hypothetical protein